MAACGSQNWGEWIELIYKNIKNKFAQLSNTALH